MNHAMQAQMKAPPVIKPIALATQSGLLQRQCACGGSPGVDGECAECRAKRLSMQRQATSSTAPSSAVPPIVHDVLRSPGQPLDIGTRTFMEPRFGHDFSNVRVHTDTKAAESARAVNALAYTVGSNVVFGNGQYSPGTSEGKRLMAHELTHVVQQSTSMPTVQTKLSINNPTGQDEVEADTVAHYVMSGRALHNRLTTQPSMIQRAVGDIIHTDTPRPDAQACLVQLHGDEKNALVLAQTLHRDYCTNLVYLDSTARCIDVSPGGKAGKCKADPNRIFSDKAIESGEPFTPVCPCPSADQAKAKEDLKQFRVKLASAISTCRGGDGSELKGPLPVVAFHNNTPGDAPKGGLSIESYQEGGEEFKKHATDLERVNKDINPATPLPGTPDDFLLVTDPKDFDVLRKQRNVVLQSTSATDDGSLSVALANERYVNVEAGGKSFVALVFATEKAMALDVFKQLGVKRCTPEEKHVPSKQKGKQPAVQPMKPQQIKSGCLQGTVKTFSNQQELDNEKACWKTFIDVLLDVSPDNLKYVIGWIVGVEEPPDDVKKAVKMQLDGLRQAVQLETKKKGTDVRPLLEEKKLPFYRSFSRSKGIWSGKFKFEHPNEFDEVSAAAEKACPNLVHEGEKWKITDPKHRLCWGVPLKPSKKDEPLPEMPKDWKPLSDDQKQQEILMASSAPGVSRHHWGTDIDFDPNPGPENWVGKGGFAGTYSWMQAHAASFGFIQPFTEKSGGYGKGYIEERWHWSYYPIAEALLDFAQGHTDEIDKKLKKLWGDDPQFSFISQQWTNFLTNVNRKGSFEQPATEGGKPK